ncbi:MAG: stringent starvation protein B [Leptospira sp.]|nr:stringent starvation protein B [Leptospira sp.]
MDENLTPEELKNIREFKTDLFTLYWERFGTFYVHILPHPRLKIGKRGLVGEEKESGIILVFGPKAVRNVHYYEAELFAELQFGYTWEDVVIPWDAIFRVYDKGQASLVQMRILPPIEDDEHTEFKPKNSNAKKPEAKSGKSEEKGKVIQVDFGGKKE